MIDHIAAFLYFYNFIVEILICILAKYILLFSLIKLGLDKNGRMAIYWGLYGVPETFLVDGSGIIIHRHAGPMTKKIFNEDFLPKMSK